ncbi:DUF192 domain-containing protein, partial [Candidatus Microgenomates bacterium]|nr:DUF192 domain-containing protein [Candidatus Microgenomates bacterium]
IYLFCSAFCIDPNSKMKEAKNLLLILAGGALFIVAVGLLSNKIQNKPLFGSFDITFASPAGYSQNFRKIKVGQADLSIVVANDAAKRKKGLSGYTNLPENEGMLFIFDEKDYGQKIFWMKDMAISIDIIWIQNGRIVQIDKNVPAEPGVSDQNLKRYTYPGNIDQVLEVTSGWSDRHNIKVGDSIS